MNLDITTTAVLRPELLRQTYASFWEGLSLHKQQVRVIINVDPVGLDCHAGDVVAVAHEFADTVVSRTPASPSFGGAVQWCWSQVDTDLFFHLEDDWVMRRPLHWEWLMQSIAIHPEYVSFFLHNNQPSVWSCPWGLDVCEYPQLCLGPTFIRKSFTDKVGPLMSPELNPEKQLKPLRDRSLYHLNKQYRHGAYVRESKHGITRDTGRAWREKYTNYKADYGFDKWTA